MSDKLQALQALLQVHPEGLSDDDRTYWAQRYDELVQAATKPSKTSTAAENSKQGRKQGTVSMSAVHSVLWVLTIAAQKGSLQVDQSISQIMAKTALGEGTVKRALSVLSSTGLVPVLSRGGGPTNRSEGRQAPQATKRWLKFADDHRQRAETQATASITQATASITQATSGPHYNTTTTPPTHAAATSEAQATSEPATGGREATEARASSDLWVEGLARAAATFWLDRDIRGGFEARNRDKLVALRLPACRDRITGDLLRHYPHARHVSPSSEWQYDELVELISLLATGNGADTALVDRVATMLEHYRPAMGAAG